MASVGNKPAGNFAVSVTNVPPETVERLRTVVQDWGREVTGAQQRLEKQIRAAATELSQIEDLLTQRLSKKNGADLHQQLETLKRENENLREALAQRDARIEQLIERLSAQTREI